MAFKRAIIWRVGPLSWLLGIMSPTLYPPPVIDSARVLAYAHVNEDISFTGTIHLHAFGKWVGRVENLAICRNYYDPQDILLLFCDSEWNSEGCIPFNDMDEAKLKAENGYPGITALWSYSPYNDAAVADFLREEYGVDPNSEWWIHLCSFCKNEVEGQCVTEGTARICFSCIEKYHAAIHEANT
jgi:hypothetical protein